MSVAEPTAAAPRRAPLALPSGPLVGLVGVFLLFVALIGAKGELHNFLSVGNARVLAHEGTIPAVVALGALLVIISGGIDLSVGSVVALVSVVTMQVYKSAYNGPESAGAAGAAAVLCGVLAGGLCGLSNGLLITRLKLPPFVATLGTMSVARGLAVLLAGRRLVTFDAGTRPGWVDVLASVQTFNPGFWSAVVLAVGVALLLRQTVFGRHVFAVGSSEPTARLCGIDADRTKVVVYTLAGLLAGWAGVLLFAQGGSGDPSAGEALELRVIAAVVIGGAALTGGRGTVLGATAGVLILELLGNGVSLFNVPVEMQYILIGLIVIANVALATWRRGGRERAGE